MQKMPIATTKRRTVNEHLRIKHIQIPKFLYYVSPYKEMSNNAKQLYGLLLDRNNLSIKNNWYDSEGCIFQYYSVKTIMDMLNVSNKTAIKLKKELVEIGLIEEVRNGCNRSNNIYILDIMNESEFMNYVYEVESEQEQVIVSEASSESSKSSGRLEPQGSVKNTLSEVKKLHTSNTELTNTELNNIYNNIDYIDDDKRTSPSGDSSAIHNEETINLTINLLREATKNELSDRSFKSVIRKVVDKYNQGKVHSFRDYLATSLARHIEALEFRKVKEGAKSALQESKRMSQAERSEAILEQAESKQIKDIPFYNWLEWK
ncbi:replication initiator protein A [Peribacillus sp. R9-11]|uniref:replication initiator protein A n=1 Tax=Peribacillus sp. R9-11 TaxID=3073271 RepID=UPI00286850CE|nr:replication initiator protein A [Peribacillus sp. R9-11]WMX58970.1 replication initiator protein A [Peribacillus sp. R9-11]